jgi:EAL domain-containing protein (putative c-di-GMP-specific phosphodiesterase class I)
MNPPYPNPAAMHRVATHDAATGVPNHDDAKWQGHGLACAYEPALRRTAPRALEHDLHSGRFVGVEALLRWQHPVYGMVAPSEFIPVRAADGVLEEA